MWRRRRYYRASGRTIGDSMVMSPDRGYALIDQPARGGHVDAGLSLQISCIVDAEIHAPAGADQRDVAWLHGEASGVGGAFQIVRRHRPARRQMGAAVETGDVE